MEKINIQLDGLGCANCANKIEARTKNIDGIEKAVLDFSQSRLTLEYKGITDKVLLDHVTKIVTDLEPHVRVSIQDPKTSKASVLKSPHDRKELLRLSFSLSLFAGGLLLKNYAFLSIVLLALAYVASGYKVLYTSYRNIRNGDIFDENFLMSLATVGAIAIGEYPEAVAVMIFYEIGEYFQDLAVSRSKGAISALMDIRPDFARVNRSGFWMDTTPEAVTIGETIMVRPGERVPLDGIVVDGASALDVSALTGESIPQNAAKGDTIASGSVVLSGLLQLEVTTLYKDSTVARILELVENATANKSPTENFITRFARVYTPIVVALAAVISFVPPLFLGFDTLGDWVYRGLVFLVISCPCALVVSVPLGFFSGIGNASKNGILVKGSNFLEALTTLDKVVFDKTGTLTKGKFAVHEVTAISGFTSDAVVNYAALCEVHSNHPIAKSIVAYYHLPISLDATSSFEELSGYGIEAQSNDGMLTVGNAKLMALKNIPVIDVKSPYTIVYVALNGLCIGAIDVRDQIKEDAFETVKALQSKGIKVAMLTGDRKSAADAVASSLGIEIVFSELLPAEKYKVVKDWLDAGEKIAFVGDGINDAPVLAGSTVGVSMGAIGSDAAIEASDVVLMTDEPSKLVKAIVISQKTKRIVTQNIVFALTTKVLIMALGALGLSSMWMAIFADVGVALIAVLNAMRAMK